LHEFEDFCKDNLSEVNGKQVNGKDSGFYILHSTAAHWQSPLAMYFIESERKVMTTASHEEPYAPYCMLYKQETRLQE
jgi:hypothetical protein